MTVVSLSKVRKARARDQAKAEAQENRVKFGRTKAEKATARAEAANAARALDQAKREP